MRGRKREKAGIEEKRGKWKAEWVRENEKKGKIEEKRWGEELGGEKMEEVEEEEKGLYLKVEGGVIVKGKEGEERRRRTRETWIGGQRGRSEG